MDLQGLIYVNKKWATYSSTIYQVKLQKKGDNLIYGSLYAYIKPVTCYSRVPQTFHKNGLKGKGKSVPLQAWSGPECSRKLRLPHFMTTQDGGKVVSLKHRPPLPPGNTPGTHLCWRLSGPQGCSAIGRILFQ